ncbi:MAG: hypothetical protein P8177_13805 [Gemmatimonadota bacterium]
MSTRAGHSLLETLVVHALLGALTTRIAAVAHGGAALILDPRTARVWTRYQRGGQGRTVDLAGRYGARLVVGSGEPVIVPYDALGIGRVGSRTIEVRRGGAVAGLTVSAYGRFRRW